MDSYRQPIVPPNPQPEAETMQRDSNGSQPHTSSVEVPYTDYAREHARPYMADHFELGDLWNDPVGGYPDEVKTIEDYFQTKIDSGEIANDTKAIKNKIKELEKMINLKGEERASVKLPTLAAHIEFLVKTDEIKRNLNRYGKVGQSGTR